MTPRRNRRKIVGPTNYFWHPRTGAVSWYAWSGFYVCIFTFALTGSVVARVPAALIGLAAFALAARLLLMGVFEDSDVLVVRNLHWTYRIPWNEVNDVDADDGRLCIRTRSRDIYPFWGSLERRPAPDAEEWLTRQVNRLNEAVGAHRVSV